MRRRPTTSAAFQQLEIARSSGEQESIWELFTKSAVMLMFLWPVLWLLEELCKWIATCQTYNISFVRVVLSAARVAEDQIRVIPSGDLKLCAPPHLYECPINLKSCIFLSYICSDV